MKSGRSLSGQADAMSAFSCTDNPLHVATYRGLSVSLERIEAISHVFTREDLVAINVVGLSFPTKLNM